ncbi:outer membrane protein assembly factor BamB [Nevskia ramosa]|uniref:outer membrane protein assembly factor BamB n=1 Tax=Nevskia ramosa TaxID=64002 RepID=UPI001FE142E9|nr:outer membrane protein assembly factor BamB [Nevskia ramosa]
MKPAFNNSLRSSLSLLLIAALAATTACSSKPKLREPTKLVEVKPEIKVQQLWSRSAGNGSGGFYSGLRLDLESDALYAAAINGGVFALDPKTGATIWQSKTKSRVISGPTVAADLVFVGTLDGDVIALKRADGKEAWRHRLLSEVVAAPVASGDIVVVRSVDGRQFGLSVADGSRVWNFDRAEPNLTLRGLSKPLILGNRVYIGLDSGKLVALNLADGVPAWEQNLSVPTGRSELERLTDVDADLLAADNGIYAVSYGNDIALIDPVAGESRWRRSIKSYTGMSADDAHLYVTDNDGLLWSLDADTGAVNWKQETLKFRRLSPPAVFGKYIVAGDYKGYLHWFESGDGHEVMRGNLGGDAVTASPVSDGERLYVLNVSGDIAAYQLAPTK